jgi:thiosulfate dehydrogenase [quinone] large subunit
MTTTAPRSTSASNHVAPEVVRGPDRSSLGLRALDVLRIGLGFIFLWPFLDKLFGLGYSTPSAKAWINGGSPTNGFLGHVEAGPLQSVFRSIAGAGWADWLFMLGLLGIGVALLTGVALRLSAVAGTILLVLMWAAEWPLAQFTSAGEATGSTNPFVDYHLIFAIALIVIAMFGTGSSWGLGKWWVKQPFVAAHAILR